MGIQAKTKRRKRGKGREGRVKRIDLKDAGSLGITVLPLPYFMFCGLEKHVSDSKRNIGVDNIIFSFP